MWTKGGKLALFWKIMFYKFCKWEYLCVKNKSRTDIYPWMQKCGTYHSCLKITLPSSVLHGIYRQNWMLDYSELKSYCTHVFRLHVYSLIADLKMSHVWSKYRKFSEDSAGGRTWTDGWSSPEIKQFKRFHAMFLGTQVCARRIGLIKKI